VQHVKLNTDKYNDITIANHFVFYVFYIFYIYNFRSFNSESTSSSISSNQSKMLMKENRDPRANRMTKICEHLT